MEEGGSSYAGVDALIRSSSHAAVRTSLWSKFVIYACEKRIRAYYVYRAKL